jgi:hypothetical protein
MSTRGLDTRIGEMEARGYRVNSRGANVAVLTRDPQRSRRLTRIMGLGLSVAAVLFGVWRGSSPFVAFGLAGAALVGIDGWIGSRAMTVRLTVDNGGRVREELIRSGD